MRRWILLAAMPLLGSVACEVTNSCDAYVDYICDCHDASEGADFDCEVQTTVYEGADAETQEFCEDALVELQIEDEEAGLVCETGTSDTGVAR